MESIAEVAHYSFSSFLLEGALTAIEIAVIAVAAGVVLGLGLAMMRLSTFAPLRGVSWFYIWFMRGTPVLLQLVFLYDALPSIGIKFDSFTTAVLGFTLNEAAFCAEIIRGGILSVDRRQTVASAALGMGPFLTLRRITLPQAMRAILPALANQSINVIKGTAVASVIFVNELTFRSQQIVGQNFKFFTVFSAAGILYLVMTSAVAALQRHLENRFNPELERLPQRPQGIWQPRDSARYRFQRPSRRGRGRDGAEWFGQEHASAPDQSPRASRQGRDRGRRQASGL